MECPRNKGALSWIVAYDKPNFLGKLVLSLECGSIFSKRERKREPFLRFDRF